MANENENSPPLNNNNSNDRSIHRIQLKVPPFWKKNPELWFHQLEAQFTTSGIRAEATKFNHVVAVLETDVLDFVSDLVLGPPAADPYQAIMLRLIKQFTPSDYKKIKSLLEELTLGDRKPTDLLRKMRELAGKTCTDDFLRTLWLQRLPHTIHTVLATNTAALDELSILADRMFDVSQATASVQSIDSNSGINVSDLMQAVRKLEGKIDSLSKGNLEPRESTGRFRQSRSPTPSGASQRVQKTSFNRKRKLCHYHKQFGKKAKQCKQPCDWINKRSENC